MKNIVFTPSHITLSPTERVKRYPLYLRFDPIIANQFSLLIALVIANFRLFFAFCQHFYTLGVEICFTSMWGFYLEVVWLVQN